MSSEDTGMMMKIDAAAPMSKVRAGTRKKFNGCRNDLAELFLDDGEQPSRDHDADDTAQTRLELTENGNCQRDRCGLVGRRDTCEGGHVGHTTGDETEDRAATEFLGSVVADNEVEGGDDDSSQSGEHQEPSIVGDGRIDHLPDAADGGDQATGDESRDDGDEDVADVTEHRLHRGGLLAADLVPGALGQIGISLGEGLNPARSSMSRDGRARRCRSVLDRRLLIDDGSRARLPQDLTEGCAQPFGMARPDDDLQLLALDNSKHPVETLDGLHVSGLCGDEVEPQPRHAIGEGLDVIRTPTRSSIRCARAL